MQLGECRFCHQMVKVDLPADSSEDERNEEATKTCGCDKAERYRAIQTGIENASAYVESVLEDVYPECVKPVVDIINHWPPTAKSFTMVVDEGVTLKVSVDNDRIFAVKYTEKRERRYKSV